MLTYPLIDPIVFHLGSWPVYWYGLMYLVGFLGGWGLLRLRLGVSSPRFSADQLSDIVFFASLGAIIGGRIGYMLFYGWPMLAANPLFLFQTWKGGMSFHGGLLGVLFAVWYCARKMRVPFLAITDFISPVIPLGLGAGRIGNFINGELWGRVTNMPWGMIFPGGGPFLRHPSQLYECLLEGVMLFGVLWVYSRTPRPLGAVSGMFALLYGIFRCLAEVFREPDLQIGYIAFDWLTEGQLLSLPLILVGILLLNWPYRQSKEANVA